MCELVRNVCRRNVHPGKQTYSAWTSATRMRVAHAGLASTIALGFGNGLGQSASLYSRCVSETFSFKHGDIDNAAECPPQHLLGLSVLLIG